MQDAVTAALGGWLVLALFSDGWAHTNVPELEGFFTPWHAALYSGLAANAAWIGWLARAGRPGPWSAVLPFGYIWGAVGVLVFAAGGLADMAWHLALGVEVGVDALLSPPHLVLLIGGMLVLTSPLRSRWNTGDTGSPVALVSLAWSSALVAFFLLYVSELAAAGPTIPYRRLPEGAPGHVEAELPALAGLGAFLVTTMVLVLPLLLVWQRGRAPRGAVSAVVVTVAWLSATVQDLEGAVVAGAVGATLGAVVADVLVQALDRRVWDHAQLRLAALAAVTAASVWSLHVAALALTAGLRWPAELWSGVVVLSTMVAAVLGGLAAGTVPSRVPSA